MRDQPGSHHSLIRATAPPHLLIHHYNVVALIYLCLDGPFAEQGPGHNVQVVLAIVALSGREKGAVEVPKIMVHRSTATIAACKCYAAFHQLRNISLGEGILVATNDYARVVGPQQQHMVAAEIKVFVQPIL